MSVRQEEALRLAWAKLQKALDNDYGREMTRGRAEQVRHWRKVEGYTLQAIAIAYMTHYGGYVSSEDHLIRGIRICRIAGEVLGERLW